MSTQLNQVNEFLPAEVTAPPRFCARCESVGHAAERCPFPDDAETHRLATLRRTRRIEGRAKYIAPEPDETPLPEFCGPDPDFVPYQWTPEQRSLRAARARHARYAALAFYRIQAGRAAARGNTLAASWYAERAAMYGRVLRPKPAQPLTGASDLRDEIASWRVMADVIVREAHLTAEHYLYC